MNRNMFFVAGLLILAVGCASNTPPRSCSAYTPPATDSGEAGAAMATPGYAPTRTESVSAPPASPTMVPPTGETVVDLRSEDELAELRQKGGAAEDDIITLNPFAAQALGLSKTEWKLSELRHHLKLAGLVPVDANGNPF